ncbi:MAG: amidohydrolase family protein [Candidatus Micrarchaeota archaeon]|nr:amidohydrolase family protein [Candidatus Micrarchaeota archaeon]
MDIFDSHVHISPTISASQIISEMDKAGVSVSNLYSGSLGIISKYPGRFIAFVDTPDSPQPSTWLTQGQAFTTSAEEQLKTGKYYGIGEANLRYYSGDIVPPPTIYVPSDTPRWLSLVDLSAKYHVPISFHFVPDDPSANVAFERMLSHNKNATFIWAHLGFNNLPLNSTKLNDFLLRYPNLYLDTAGIQNMQNPLPKPNSNWALLANGSNNGRSNGEWRQFFETWNSRILFGSDAGGGKNGLERWLNYADNTVNGATPNAVGHWGALLSNLDYNSARNILSGNARTLILKEQKPSYNYLVSSDGMCHSISVSSNSSVSGLTFDQNARAITFTVADSIGTVGSASITVPTAIARGNFTASVDGQSVQIKEIPSSTYTTVSLGYTGGIRSITIIAPGNASN